MSETETAYCMDGIGQNERKDLMTKTIEQVKANGFEVIGYPMEKFDIDNFSVTDSSVDDEDDDSQKTVDYYGMDINKLRQYNCMRNSIDVVNLPSDWTIKHVTRKSGKSKGRVDHYYISPSKFKFRSMIEVREFINFIFHCRGNETEAYELWKKDMLLKKNKKKKNT